MANKHDMTAVEALERERNRIISELISQCDCTSLQTQCENKIVSLDEVKDNDFSLTPGRYVGVTFVEDDGVDFKSRLSA